MYMPDFDYHAPTSVAEACALLAGLGERAKVLAGGTDLLHKMKTGSLAPSALISLRKIEGLRNIRYEAGRGVLIGPMATQNEIMESPVLHERYRSVSEAAHQMASNPIRNLGTVGGNIVNAVPSADLPPILIALRAEIELVGVKGARRMPLEDFFTGAAQSVIAPDEVLTEILIPDQPTTGSAYLKFGLRRSGALAVVGAAVSLTVQRKIIKDARVVLASSAPTVLRVREAEDFLRGRMTSEEVFAEAGKIASGASRARNSIRGSADYRKHLAGVLTKRALRKAASGHA